MEWTEIQITVDAEQVDAAGDIAQMVVPYGIYIEDYRNLEEETWEIAGIDLIEDELLAKDKSKGIVHIYISPQENPAEAVAFLSERYTAEHIAHTIHTLPCKNEDWENNWKAYFKPIPVGSKLLIHPVWEEDCDSGDRKVIEMEPGLAFGSGTHETTRLCLEALENHIEHTTEVLDLGCGSGILSVAALKLGAKRAVGVDIDKLAVKTAVENGKMNGFSAPEFTVLCGNLTEKVEGKFDVIAANIVADIIIAFTPQVSDYLKENGVFITSGIIDAREQEVTQAFARNGFRIAARHEENGWLCFECKK